MGFTIEDMLTASKEHYKLELIAGKQGWSNSISWIMMIEDTRVIQNFRGKELVVTTGLGFSTKDKLMTLAKKLVESHASGLIINVGEYVTEVPSELMDYCDETDLPLITMPWEIIIADMVKDISMRIFLQGAADEQISNAMINAIEMPDNQEGYRKELLPYFDVEGSFEVVIITTDGLAEMDTVIRRRLSNRIEIYFENITHNGNFFYYDGDFVLVVNNIHQGGTAEIVEGMVERAKRRLLDVKLYVGMGSRVTDISNLYISYERAKAAAKYGQKTDRVPLSFDEMGLYRLLYSVKDKGLLEEMVDGPLAPVIEYDKKHDSNYLETLDLYLKYDGSIKAVSDAMFTHRNTIIYRITNIKKLLDTELDSQEEKLKYQLALYIKDML